LKTISGDDQNEKNSFQLSNNRFVTISEFRNKVRVDVREYYLNDDGEKKPGKKGISLSLEEWNKLKDLMPKIESAIKGTADESNDDDNDSDSSVSFSLSLIPNIYL
jgi:hypothetical protein